IDVASKFSHSGLDTSFRRPPRGGVEQQQFEHFKEKVEGCILADMMDRWFWPLEGSGKFTVASVRKTIDDFMLLEVSSKTRWIKAVPIKVNVHAWKVKLGGLPTRLNISRRGIDIESVLCPMCGKAVESTSHIFFTCEMSKEILRKISRWWDIDYMEVSSYKEWLDWILNMRLSVKSKQLLEGVCYVLWWYVWSFRNKCIFGSQFPSKAVIFDDVVSSSFYWCCYRCYKESVFKNARNRERRNGIRQRRDIVRHTWRVEIFLENVVRNAVTSIEHARCKTVTAMDVVYALKRQGRWKRIRLKQDKSEQKRTKSGSVSKPEKI
nr:RNA-directed DNA polymerase, eukaryota [Tanacetum cinerariifolium]